MPGRGSSGFAHRSSAWQGSSGFAHAALVTVFLTAAAATAQVRIDISSQEAIKRNLPELKKKLGAERFAGLQADITTITGSVLCPSDPERADLDRLFEREEHVMKAINGKTPEELRALSAKITAALAAERAGMREVPLDSPQAEPILRAATHYLQTAPEDAESYDRFFPFWTQERIATARLIGAEPKVLTGAFGPESPGDSSLSLPLPAPKPYERRLSTMQLYSPGWLKKLQVLQIRANASKAYVRIGLDDVQESLLTTFLLDDGAWKAHADLFGYPWSREWTPAVECVAISDVAP